MGDKKIWNDWAFIIMACLTLGLAPFVPEPHIWGKVRWILGGAKGMALMDWADFLMHGIPWMLLIRLVVIHIVGKDKQEK
ncbi:MAG: hypothetical protein IPG48_09910 [Saprospiraceae bacterium]|nr:hypothetical protein [Saprospiraceae bacterium]MBP6540821.1 hypothetical protein [Saprospiraceae bacterium]HQV66169.1 hypothetical protein [Saprospiraceae bacterium]HQV97982.1 hypothetical protein [Saprospiraceae bacterium]